MPIKVVEAISDLNVGGAGKLLLNRIKQSNNSLFDYTVILPKGSLLAEMLKKEKIKVLEINGCKNKSFDFKGIGELLWAIKHISPDILNSHACMSARIAGRVAGVSVNLYTRHCDFPVKSIFSFSIVNICVKALNDFLSDGIIAVSNSAKKNLLLLGASKGAIKVIINGSEAIPSVSIQDRQKVRNKLKIPSDAVVVGIFARLEECKDHKTLLRAAKVLEKHENIYFLIVGSGKLESELKAYSQRLGIAKRVIFTGFVKNITDLMNITDINVNCSIGTETSSLALSEGMSLGIPAIASDYSGNKYMVKNKVNGLIFPQRNYRELAKNILFLAQDNELYIRLSENARKRFYSELNALRMTKDTEKYYFDMLKRKRLLNGSR